MSVPVIDIAEVIRTILIMSLAGSIIALFLFMLKPFVKDRIPKLFQYYMWLVVLVALIVPVSKIVIIPAPIVSAGHHVSLTPIHDLVQQSFLVIREETDSLVFTPQGMDESVIVKSQKQLPSMPTIIFIVWAIGVFAFTGLSITRYVLFSRKLRKRAVPANELETGLLKELSGMESIPKLYRNALALTPMLIGIVRPAIMLPDYEYTDAQLRNIILHELTHLRRRDVIIKWLSMLAAALHWFNPIVYILRREINASCELACDETIIRSLDKSGKQNYGDTLIAVVATHRILQTALSTTMCEEKKALKKRLATIMKYKKTSRTALVLSCILLITVICGTVVLGAASGSDDKEALNYPLNADGQTYGTAQFAYSIGSLPDLIHAGSIDNVDIYIYAQDILDAMPKTLEEMQDGSYLATVFTLYENDGKTVHVFAGADYSFGIQFLPISVRSEYAIPPYPVNKNGQTFGNMAFVGPYNPVRPDLIACIGIDGTEGYCYQTDLNGVQPNNPDEAMEYMNRLVQRYEEMRRNGDMYVRVIPLYAEDGVTVIGEFGIE